MRRSEGTQMRRRMRARLRALRQARSRRSRTGSRESAGPTRESVLAMIGAACLEASLGLDVCAKRSRHDAIHQTAASLAARARSIAVQIAPQARTRMADRMRWEWVASTATIVSPFGREPMPERRVVADCLRAFDGALDAACAFQGDLPLVAELLRLVRSIDTFHASLRLALEPHAEA